MVPLNFLEERVAVPLQHFMAVCSTAVLNWLGVAAQRVGTGIYSSMFQFNVDKPCSGIQSLMALTTVTAAYAYVTQHEQWKRWLLFLTAMPLAVLGNMARVVLVALVAQNYGQKVAMDLHDTVAGYIVFAVALTLMVFIGWLLDLPYRRLWSHCIKPVEPQQASL
jgi:exosortase